MSQVPAADAQHRAERGRRLKLAILTSIIARPLAVLIPVLVVPLYIRYLGAERYGLFEAISSIAVWVGLTNIGFGFGLRNCLMDCYVSGNRQLARTYVSTLFVAMLALLALGAPVAAGLTTAWDWALVLNAGPSVSQSELRWAIVLAFLIPLLGVSFNFTQAVYFAYQEIHHLNGWEAAAKLATVLACLGITLTPLGLPGAILALSGTPVAVAILNHLWMWYWRKPWLCPSLRLYDSTLLRKLLGTGFLLFLLQSAVVMTFQTDRLVIGVLRTPEEVAQYGVVSRVFMLAYGAFFLVLGPLWPAYGEAFRRGDVDWCRRKLRLSIFVGIVCMLTCGAVLAVGRGPVFSRLAGGQLEPVPLTIIIGMTVACLLRTWADCHSVMLNGANILLPQVLLVGTSALLSFAVSLVLTRWWGVAGTVWSYPVAAVLTTVWGYPWILHRATRRLQLSQDGNTDA